MGVVKVDILHFSDLLCVWAYVAQVRMDELQQQVQSQRTHWHFVGVFGDSHRKLAASWGHRGGVAAYGQHVRNVVARFDHVQVHPKVWVDATPRSSMSCHLFLRAVGAAEAAGDVRVGGMSDLAWKLRTLFFQGAVDVSTLRAQWEATEALDLARAPIQAALADGRAHADLSRDMALGAKYGVSVSPTLVFNEGRQRLVGNVGYRVIEANVRELLNQPVKEASWC